MYVRPKNMLILRSPWMMTYLKIKCRRLDSSQSPSEAIKALQKGASVWQGIEHVWFKISINVDQMGCSVKLSQCQVVTNKSTNQGPPKEENSNVGKITFGLNRR